MPFTAVYLASIFIQPMQAEGLTEAQARAIVGALPAGWLQTLVNHMSEPATNGTGLAHWRQAFPQILKTGSDAGDSFLVRVAVAFAGGVVV